MAEIKTGLLTAAHDLTKVELPLVAEVAVGDEVYQRLDKTEQKLKEGDLFIKDQKGILSSVIYGPDSRTQIRQSTDQALFTTYGPPGIKKEQIIDQFEILESYLKLFAPQLIREEMIVI
jgi:DNA/RNA-binding domain of Phe-tRNA-synthetase-like protein